MRAGLLVLLAGCGGDEPVAAPHAEVVVTRPEAPASEPVKCPPAVIPEGAERKDGLVDLDRDGSVDHVFSFRDDDGWYLVVDVDGKGAVGAGPDPTLTTLVPAGGADVGGPGRDVEVFAVVGDDGETPLLGAWVRQGCALVRLTRDGAPATFPLGTVPGATRSLACSHRGLEVRERTPAADGEHVRSTSLELVGTELRVLAETDDVVTGDRRRPERCGTVHVPEAR